MAELIRLASQRGPLTGNVIFVHGLSGDPRETWTSPPLPSMEDRLWPTWLTEDIEGLEAWSVGYEAAVSSWRGSAMDLTDRASNVLSLLLVEPDLQKGELIFVGHSLGGLVIKQVLRKAADTAREHSGAHSLVDRTRKVAFLATPHLGADLARWGDRLRVLFRPSLATKCLIRNDPHLRDLNLWYRRWAREREIRHLILTENKTTFLFGLIVKPDSSDPGLSSDPITIDADHSTIAKPRSKEDQVYKLVRAFIEREAEKSVSNEEKKIDIVGQDTQAIRAIVERLTAEISMTSGEREALAADFGAIKAQLQGTFDLISGFLETVIGRKVPPEQFAPTLFKIAADWKSAGERIDALSFSGSLSSDLAELRNQARAAHAVGRLDEAERLLGRIACAEIDALERLEDHEREVQDQIRRRKREVAGTKVAQATVAHTRLNYRNAAALYREASNLVASFDARLGWQWVMAAASELCTQGKDFGDIAALDEAIEHFRECLTLAPRDRAPLDWAITQNDLSLALRARGAQETGTTHLEQAIEACQAALQEHTRERGPLKWAGTQMNLALALKTLGDRENGTLRLEQAVKVYRLALEEWTPEQSPVEWALTHDNLGSALSTIGERERGTSRLQEAVAAFLLALKVRTREQAPLDWAGTQMNLGNALRTLGEREHGTARLEKAVRVYQAVLEVHTRERVPLKWASTQMNLGVALLTLGVKLWTFGIRYAGTARLQEAIRAFRLALEAATRERAPLQWATIKMNLGLALTKLGEWEVGTARLEEAVAEFRDALQIFIATEAQYHVGNCRANLAVAQRLLADRMT